jgi:hypothetical protein
VGADLDDQSDGGHETGLLGEHCAGRSPPGASYNINSFAAKPLPAAARPCLAGEPLGRERYSCPFFFDPNVATEIGPLACCVTPGRPVAFEPMNFGTFLRCELEAAYDRHKRPPRQA